LFLLCDVGNSINLTYHSLVDTVFEQSVGMATVTCREYVTNGNKMWLEIGSIPTHTHT